MEDKGEVEKESSLIIRVKEKLTKDALQHGYVVATIMDDPDDEEDVYMEEIHLALSGTRSLNLQIDANRIEIFALDKDHKRDSYQITETGLHKRVYTDKSYYYEEMDEHESNKFWEEILNSEADVDEMLSDISKLKGEMWFKASERQEIPFDLPFPIKI